MTMETAAETRDQAGRFLTGQAGPGRQKGSRNKLAGDFIDTVYAKWQKHGDRVIEHMATHEPVRFAQMVAALIPQHFKVEHEHNVRVLTDEQIRARMLELTANLAEPQQIEGK